MRQTILLVVGTGYIGRRLEKTLQGQDDLCRQIVAQASSRKEANALVDQ